MKPVRIISVPMLALSLSGTASAQAEQEPFWYVQPQAGVSWSVGEAPLGDLLSPAAQLSVGRQFSPLWGLRVGASGWQGRNWLVRPKEEYKWKYVQANVEVTLSVLNWWAGVDAERRWDVYAFLGGGLHWAFDNDEANRLAACNARGLRKVWDDSFFGPALRGGLGVDYSLTDRVALGLEANVNMLADKWNSKKGSGLDWQDHLLLGVKVALGKGGKRAAAEEAVALEPALEAAGATVTAPVEPAEPAGVEVAAKPVSAPVAEAGASAAEPEASAVQAGASANDGASAVQASAAKQEDLKVYFRRNSSRITWVEAEKVRQMADYLRANKDRKLLVKGCASADGNVDYNLLLSGWRAVAVKQCLVSYGVEADRIATEPCGVVNGTDVSECRTAICFTVE